MMALGLLARSKEPAAQADDGASGSPGRRRLATVLPSYRCGPQGSRPTSGSHTNLWRLGNELRFVIGLGSYGFLGALALVWAAGLVALWRRECRAKRCCSRAQGAAGGAQLPVSITVADPARTRTDRHRPRSSSRSLRLARDQRRMAASWRGGRAGGRAVAACPASNGGGPENNGTTSQSTRARPTPTRSCCWSQARAPLGHACRDRAKVAMRGVPVDFPRRAAPRATRRAGTPSAVGQTCARCARGTRPAHGRRRDPAQQRLRPAGQHAGAAALIGTSRTRAEFTQGSCACRRS
jgi:hypothetical protein